MKPEYLAISERIRDHLIQQKGLSVNLQRHCAYRDYSGRLMCAVGCLIKDEEYDGDLENKRIFHPTVKSALKRSLGLEMTPDLLQLLSLWQYYHDDNEYLGWVVGEEVSTSPDKFHSHMVAKFA